MLEAICPNGHRLQIPPEHAGMKLRCPACNSIFQLAGGPQNPAASGVGLQNAPGGQAPQPAPAPAPAAPQQHAPAAAPSAQQYAVESPPARWTGSEPPAAPAAPMPAPQPAPAVAPRPASSLMRSFDIGGAARTWGQIAMMVGLVLVLSARGCDGLALRNIARLKADIELAGNKLDDEETSEKASYQRQLENPQESGAHETARKRISEISDNYRKKRTELAASAASIAGRDAEGHNRTWAYFREMAFVAGSIVLALGLIALMMYGLPAERYLAFGMLVIILFSLYIGGAAWNGSVTLSVKL